MSHLRGLSYLAFLFLLLSVVTSLRASHDVTALSQRSLGDLDYEVLSEKHAVKGEQQMLVILVEFSDVNHTRSPETIRKLVLDEVSAYYSEVSYGQVSIIGEVYGWVRMEHPMGYYGHDRNGPGGDYNVRSLAQDAVASLPPSFNLARFKFLVVVHAGGNQAVESPGRESDEIWSTCYCAIFPRYVGYTAITVSSKSFKNYAFLSEQDDLSTYAHETGHLFGLPDLYDTLTGRTYVGYWSLMDYGVYCCGSDKTPPYIGGWGAALLGWVKPTVPEEMMAFWSNTLEPLESPKAKTVLIPISAATYYFVEYRASIGRDSNLPNSGVVVYYVDETLRSGRGIVKLVDQKTGLPLESQANTKNLSEVVFRSGEMLKDGMNRVYLAVLGPETPTLLYSRHDLADVLLKTSLETSTQAVTLPYGYTIPLTAILRDELGRAVSDQNVSLQIRNQTTDWKTVSHASTGQNGQMSFDLSLKQDIGPYVLRLVYSGGRSGDHWYIESEHEISLLITLGRITVSAYVPFLIVGERLSIDVTIFAQRGQTVADVPLHVFLDGERVRDLTTDKTGRSSLILQVGSGAHKITIASSSPNYEETSITWTVNSVPTPLLAVGFAVSLVILAIAIMITTSNCIQNRLAGRRRSST